MSGKSLTVNSVMWSVITTLVAFAIITRVGVLRQLAGL